ncbi:gamma-glutamyltransferase [Pseudooceanicola spongiae]|uniref:Glutathione hydrolase proenzyme n=1 Tax=Pseudooceanicola spongiae TaxID=2613965 RepID=A0A7L9WIT4_9RHOB|nr:gamma-glutamyltransferase [Pseudooceanicola spongiae]QOL79438.1 gamma-glutamyltransferase [Pseudooceanicola spongiae]
MSNWSNSVRLALAILALPLAPAWAQQSSDAVAPETGTPEAATGALAAFPGLSEAATAALKTKAEGKPVEAQTWMISAANPLAVQAGAKVLKAGGSAADAMIAVQAVLGLVEPQSSGLGGGAFLVWFDAATGKLTTLDGRETAPLDATPQLFQTETGEALRFFDAVVGGRSVGTPGTPRLLEAAHELWGKAEWSGLFADAIALAEDGFTVSPRLADLIAADDDRLRRFPETEAYFYPGGTALHAGETLRNPAYADTLRQIADGGAKAFYIGDIADDIAATVQQAPGNPGVLSALDLAIYEVKERPAVCAPYRAAQVCGMGPPSSGALTIGEILGMLQGYDIATMGPDAPETWRLIGDASRLAFADRGRYMADTDFVPMPLKGLIEPAYLARRAELLDSDIALPDVAPGLPDWDHAGLLADDTAIELPSTSHISIVDAAGNALSMTTTIENSFGSRLFVRGFLLNNELTDFSFDTQKEGVPIANRVEPGKRPRSSMSPTIVMQDGAPTLVIGSPGGSTIIGYVAQAIIAHLDWGMDVQQAVSMPHLVNRFGPYEVESDTTATALQESLEGLGYTVQPKEMNSGLHAISIGEGLRGGADPRREGIALGE